MAVLAVCVGASTHARADDTAEASTSVFAEKRDGGKGGLTVVHPQADVGIDLGRYVTLDAGYSADAVSGATATVYQVDAVTSATNFSDLRQQGDLGLAFRGRRSTFKLVGSFGTERDYLAHSIGGDASVDLAGRNTTVDIAYTHSFDQVCDADNGSASPLERRALTHANPCLKTDGFVGENDPGVTVWHDLSIDTAQASVTQNLTPTMNMQVALYGQILDGFQSNPYRRVQVGSTTPQENEPDERARWSLSARLNRYLPQPHAAVQFSARFYDDTWGVVGGDVELAYSQYLGNNLLVRFHARVYQQTAATFFKDAFFYQTQSTAGQYFTGDRELSPVRDAVLGAKLMMISIKGDQRVWHVFDRLQLNLKADVLLLDHLAAEDPTTNPMGIDKEFLYGNSLLDAVELQLGLLATY
jgi:hypothetical protein